MDHPVEPRSLYLELVRATDLYETGHAGRTALVLIHTTLLLHSLVPQEVPMPSGTTQYLTGTGYLELLGNGFTCFDHWKNEHQNALIPPCKADSAVNCIKNPPP